MKLVVLFSLAVVALSTLMSCSSTRTDTAGYQQTTTTSTMTTGK